MELRPYARLVLLALGIGVASVPQIVAHEEQVPCNETQYHNEDLNRCCNRCPPGHHVTEECTLSSETVCQPCGNRSFATSWNYAPRCIRCHRCSKYLVERQPCNATHDKICGCPDGSSCTQNDAFNKCQICVRLPRTEPTVSEPGGPPADMKDTKNTWISVGVLLFAVTVIVVVICLKTRLLKRFGHMIKNKSSSESTPQPETAVDITLVGKVNKGPASPLLEDGQMKMSLQEVGKVLNHPVQVSDDTEVGILSVSQMSGAKSYLPNSLYTIYPQDHMLPRTGMKYGCPDS